MLIENQTVDMTAATGNVAKYYRDKGYEFEMRKPFKVNVTDLPNGSNKQVWVTCDYCKKDYQMQYKKYIERVVNGIVHKCACWQCEHFKIAETNMIKYGMSTNALPDVKAKKVESFRKNFGVDNPMQSKEIQNKMKDTMLERYGVEYRLQSQQGKDDFKNIMMQRYGVNHPSQSKELLERRKINTLNKYGVEHTLQLEEVRQKIAQTNFKNNTCKLSVEQLYISNLFDATLNYPIGRYNVDMLLDDNIILEFDGTGHDLNILYGRLTPDEFNQKEMTRTKYLLGKGYKIIRFIHKRHTKIQDKTYMEALEQCKMKLQYCSQVEYNFDDNTITIK